MASKIANKVAKRYFAGHVARYEPEDPYYETYVDGKGRSRRRKRALPAGLTAGQAKLLRKIKRRAHYLDKGFTVCGFRFGWTFVIGLVPGLGDAVNALLGYGLVIRPATRGEELPAATVKRMVFNSAVSAGVGLVPLVGDVAVAAWKANSRNAHLFEACKSSRVLPPPAAPTNGTRDARPSRQGRGKHGRGPAGPHASRHCQRQQHTGPAGAARARATATGCCCCCCCSGAQGQRQLLVSQQGIACRHCIV